jgi:bacteriocin-like protein
MKTLFANNENNLFDSFEILTKEELNQVKGGAVRDMDAYPPLD